MTLHNWIRGYVSKYSFVTRTEFKEAIFFIYYQDLKGKEQVKKLQFRTTKEQLIVTGKYVDKIC